MPKQDSTRLDSTDWILAGLETLAAEGVQAVRVETLAKRLGITKGSFYWHFKNRADLLHHMLAYWSRHATARIIERLDQSGLTPVEKLRLLMALPVQGKRAAEGAAVELAIRLWARSDSEAAKAVGGIDAQRLQHIRHLAQAAGKLSQAEAEARAYLIYAFMLAEAIVAQSLSPAALRACEVSLGIN